MNNDGIGKRLSPLEAAKDWVLGEKLLSIRQELDLLDRVRLAHQSRRTDRGAEVALMGWYDCLISEVVFCSLEPSSGELAEDLLAEGRVYLLEQIRKFDPKYGVEPAEYFVEMLELHLRKKQRQLVGGFSASEKARLNLAKMQAERARLQSAGFEVNAEVLANNLNLSKEQVWDLLSLEGVVSYDAPLTLSDDEQVFFVEHLSDLSQDRSAVEMVTELVEIAQVLDPELAKAINCQLNGGDELPADLALKARQLLLELNP